MDLGNETASSPDPRLVGRLVEAGVLATADDGLHTTPQWHERLGAASGGRRDRATPHLMERVLSGTVPDAPEGEIKAMARLVLFVEAMRSAPIDA